MYPDAESEIGWFPIEPLDAGRGGDVFRFSFTKDVFHWYGETFELPAGADRHEALDRLLGGGGAPAARSQHPCAGRFGDDVGHLDGRFGDHGALRFTHRLAPTQGLRRSDRSRWPYVRARGACPDPEGDPMTIAPGTTPSAEALALASPITPTEYGMSHALDAPEPARMLFIRLRERSA